MTTFRYTTSGTCSREIVLTLNDDNTIADVTFVGGCPGNTQGVGALVRGLDAHEAMERLRGIECGSKGTSCPDQLSHALESALSAAGAL